MKMKFCHYFYEKNKHPKYYDKACKMMEMAKNCAFTSQNEINILAVKVKAALEKDKPQGSPAKLVHTKGAGGGQLSIVAGVDNDIAHLYYNNITCFWEYDMEREVFVSVSERFEKGGSR